MSITSKRENGIFPDLKVQNMLLRIGFWRLCCGSGMKAEREMASSCWACLQVSRQLWSPDVWALCTGSCQRAHASYSRLLSLTVQHTVLIATGRGSPLLLDGKLPELAVRPMYWIMWCSAVPVPLCQCVRGCIMIKVLTRELQIEFNVQRVGLDGSVCSTYIWVMLIYELSLSFPVHLWSWSNWILFKAKW